MSLQSYLEKHIMADIYRGIFNVTDYRNHPNFLNGAHRKFKCKICGGKPPEIVYNHFISSVICNSCMDIFRGLFIIGIFLSPIILAVLTFLCTEVVCGQH